MINDKILAAGMSQFLGCIGLAILIVTSMVAVYFPTILGMIAESACK